MAVATAVRDEARPSATMRVVQMQRSMKASFASQLMRVAAIFVSVAIVPIVTAYPNNYPKPTFNCPSAGFFPAPGSCTKFIRCVDFHGTGRHFTVFTFSCGPGTVYDQRIIGCNHPWAVPDLNCSPNESPTGNQVRSYDQQVHTHSQRQKAANQPGTSMHRQQPWYKTNSAGHPRHQQQPTRHPVPQRYHGQVKNNAVPGNSKQQTHKQKQPVPSSNKVTQSQRPRGNQPRNNKAPARPAPKSTQKAKQPPAANQRPPIPAPKPASAKVTQPPSNKKQAQGSGKKPPTTLTDVGKSQGGKIQNRPKPKPAAPSTKNSGPSKQGKPSALPRQQTANQKRPNSSPINQKSPPKQHPGTVKKPQVAKARPTQKQTTAAGQKPGGKGSSAKKQQPKPQSSPQREPPAKKSTNPAVVKDQPTKPKPTHGGQEKVPTQPGTVPKPLNEKPGYQRAGGTNSSAASHQPPCSPAKPQVTCTESGFYSLPNSCTRFYRCVDWHGDGSNYGVFYFTCGPGTMFDDALDTCTHPTATAMQDCPDCEMKDLFPQQFAQMHGGQYPEGRQNNTLTTPANGQTASPSLTSSGDPYAPPVTSAPSGSTSEGVASSSESNGYGEPQATTLPARVPTIILTEAPDGGISGEGQTDLTTTSNTETVTQNTPDAPGSSHVLSGNCSAPGLYPIDGSCLKYYECIENPDGTFSSDVRRCPSGYLFDKQTQDCSSEALLIATRDCPNDELNALYGGEETVPTGTEPTLTSPYELTPTHEAKETDYPETSTQIPVDQENQGHGAKPCSGGQTYATRKPSCTEDGFFPTAGTGCQKFHRCWRVGTGFSMAQFDCPPGTLFDDAIDVCNHPWAFTCTDQATSSDGSDACQEDREHPEDQENEIGSHEGYPSQKPQSASGCTPEKPPQVECTEEGFFPVPGRCAKFYRCYMQGPKLAIAHFDCAPGTVFNDALDVCDHPWAVDCKDDTFEDGCAGGEEEQATEEPKDVTTETYEHLTTDVDGGVDGKELFTPSTVTDYPNVTPTQQGQETTDEEAAVTDPSGDLSTTYDANMQQLTTEGQQETTEVPTGTDLTTPQTSPDTTEPGSVPTDQSTTDNVEEQEQTVLTTVTELSTYTSTVTPLDGSVEMTISDFSTVTNDLHSLTTTSTVDEYSSVMQCDQEGYYPLPGSCKKFFRCVDFSQSGEAFTPFLFSCGPGTVYSPDLHVCVHPEQLDPPKDCPDDEAEAAMAVTPHPMTGMAMGQPTVREPTAEDCLEEGYFRHPSKCSSFYRCVDLYQNGTFTVYHFECGPGTVFDDVLDVCVHPENVQPPCDDGTTFTGETGVTDVTTEDPTAASETPGRLSRMNDEEDPSVSEPSTTQAGDEIDLRQQFGNLDDGNASDSTSSTQDPSSTSVGSSSTTFQQETAGSSTTDSTPSTPETSSLQTSDTSMLTSSTDVESTESPSSTSETTVAVKTDSSSQLTTGMEASTLAESASTEGLTNPTEVSTAGASTDSTTTGNTETSETTPGASSTTTSGTSASPSTSTDEVDSSSSASTEEESPETPSASSETAAVSTTEPTTTTVDEDRKAAARILDESTTEDATTSTSPNPSSTTATQVPDTSTDSTTIQVTEELTMLSTPAPTISFTLLCGSGMNLRHPVHCNRFYQCNFDGWDISISVSQCEGGKVFEQEGQECVDQNDAPEGSTDDCQIITEPPKAVRRRRQSGTFSDSDSGDHDANVTVPMSFLVTQGTPMYCKQSGLFPFESDCERFYKCPEDMSPVNLANGVYPRAELLRCPHGHSFDASSRVCLGKDKAQPCHPDKSKLALVYLEYTPEEVEKAPAVLA